MRIIEGNNITDVFYTTLDELYNNPDFTTNGIFEISPVLMKVAKPSQRCLVIPHRQNNIIQTIAETLWVLGGKNDLEYLSKYLPRAYKFSDDGETWRGGYGPRLRNWCGVDQISAVASILRKNQTSARAVMGLFDPKTDISLDWKDVPCNNLIQFIIRNGKLNMHVSLRANDIVWGFSGINFFEWSVLHEMLSNWLNIEQGTYYHYSGFITLFKRHQERAGKMLVTRLTNDIYTCPDIKIIQVDIPENEISSLFKTFFEVEKQLHEYDFSFVDNCKSINSISSRFLRHCLSLMYCYLLLKKGNYAEFNSLFDQIENDHMKISAAHYFRWAHKNHLQFIENSLKYPFQKFDYRELAETLKS